MLYLITYVLLMISPSVIIAQPDSTNDLLDVPFVPTPQQVVERMLEIASITAADTLFDLGCGDGRIAITAALKFGSRGFGIDIDPERIIESRENAAGLSITERVTFIEQDLFEADIRSATVVTLYLLRTVNLALRPKLFRDLRPGTKIVSHDFSMGDWQPDRHIQVDNAAMGSHHIYYWVIPANVSGEWRWIVPASPVSAYCSLSVEQIFQQVSGTISHGGSQVHIRDMVVDGPIFSFVTEEKTGDVTVIRSYSGTVVGNHINGMCEILGSEQPPLEWNAVRDPSTVTPIENYTSVE